MSFKEKVVSTFLELALSKGLTLSSKLGFFESVNIIVKNPGIWEVYRGVLICHLYLSGAYTVRRQHELDFKLYGFFMPTKTPTSIK